jgi:hypothetical protein
VAVGVGVDVSIAVAVGVAVGVALLSSLPSQASNASTKTVSARLSNDTGSRDICDSQCARLDIVFPLAAAALDCTSSGTTVATAVTHLC